MQNSGLIRLAHSVFARPFCHQEAFASVVKGWQCPCVQRSVSTSATARDSSEAADSSDSASKSQQGASDVKDVAKVAHANELRQLRRKWKAQHAEKLAIKAKADAKKAANKAVMIEGHRRNVAAMKELRGQMHEEKRRLQFADMARHLSPLILLKQCCRSVSHAQQLLSTSTRLLSDDFRMRSQQTLWFADTTTSSCRSVQICNSAGLCTAEGAKVCHSAAAFRNYEQCMSSTLLSVLAIVFTLLQFSPHV